jgi:GH35 family endo-1,4-beta-xylanase
MKLTLTKVYRNDKDKQGQPLRTKDGRAYTRLAVKCVEYGDKYISFFGHKDNASWKEGDTIEAEVEQRGEYLNGSTKPKPVSREEFNELVERVKALESGKVAEVNLEEESDLPF